MVQQQQQKQQQQQQKQQTQQITHTTGKSETKVTAETVQTVQTEEIAETPCTVRFGLTLLRGEPQALTQHHRAYVIGNLMISATQLKVRNKS